MARIDLILNSTSVMKKFSKFLITSLLVTGFSIGLIYILTDVVGLWYMASAVLVSGALTVIGFIVNYLWTWRIKNKEMRAIVASRFIKYVIVGGSIAVLTWGLLYVLTEFAHLWYILSLVIVWIVGMIIAFVVNNFWTYKEKDMKKEKRQTCPNCGEFSLCVDKEKMIERCPICHYYLDANPAIEEIKDGIRKLKPEILGQPNRFPKDWRSRVLK